MAQKRNRRGYRRREELGKRNRARADGMHAREMDTLYEEAEAEASASHFAYAQPQYGEYANGMVLVFLKDLLQVLLIKSF